MKKEFTTPIINLVLIEKSDIVLNDSLTFEEAIRQGYTEEEWWEIFGKGAGGGK